eukprot:6179274-Pleurochrysis_carterae.AAC.1
MLIRNARRWASASRYKSCMRRRHSSAQHCRSLTFGALALGDCLSADRGGVRRAVLPLRRAPRMRSPSARRAGASAQEAERPLRSERGVGAAEEASEAHGEGERRRSDDGDGSGSLSLNACCSGRV